MQASVPGELLLDETVLANPNEFYRRLIAEAPVWHVGETDIYTANSHEAVTEACRRVEDFSSNLAYFLYRDERGLPARQAHGAASAQILATADPPLHARHKKVISPAFSPGRIASLDKEIAGKTHRHLAEGLAEGRIEFMSQLANPIPIEVVSDLIAFSERNTDALLRMAMVQTDMLASAIPLDVLEERLSISDDTFVWIVQQLQSAIQAPGEGILGELARGIAQGEVEMVVAISILAILFAAGGESTSSLIGNAVHILASDLELQQEMRSSPTMIPKFVEEVLRLESPFRHHMRLVKRATTLCGVEIPEGATLLLMWGAANRDPAVFHRPDEIDLDRPRRHVAFGSGIHVCLGNTLARLGPRIIIETLLAATREFRIDDGRTTAQVPSLAVRRFQSLPLLLDAR